MIRGVVFGRFHLLHEGHKSLLRFATSIVDHLTVYCVTDGEIVHPRQQEIAALPDVDCCLAGAPDIVEFVKANDIDFVISGSKEDPTVTKELQAILKEFCKVIVAPISLPLAHIERRVAQNFEHDLKFLEKFPALLKKVNEIFDKPTDKNVLVLGDLIIDVFEECEGVGMSQESPTLVVKPVEKKIFYGGAGIVGLHMNSFYPKTSFISSVGSCDDTSEFKRTSERSSMKCFLYNNKQDKTVTKKRICLNGFPVLRINDFPSVFEDEDYLEFVGSIISKNKFDLVIFSDFNYGSITNNIYFHVLEILRGSEAIIVCDSQSSSQVGKIEIFTDATLLCMTVYEARLALRDFSLPINKLAEAFLNNFEDVPYCIIKLGEHGLIVASRDSRYGCRQEHIKALNIDPLDVSGAGDALLVGTSIGLSENLDIFEAAYLGSLFAAVQCSRLGNVPVQRSDIMGLLK